MGMVSLLLGAERENNPLFWEVMGGKGEIAPAEEAMTDKEVAEEMAESVFLYKYAHALTADLSPFFLSNERRNAPPHTHHCTLRTHPRRVMEVDGDMQAIPITETPFVRDMLESTFTYILDCETEIFIWVGKKSDWESKASGIMLADVRVSEPTQHIARTQRTAQHTAHSTQHTAPYSTHAQIGLPHHVRATFVDSDDAHARGHRDRAVQEQVRQLGRHPPHPRLPVTPTCFFFSLCRWSCRVVSGRVVSCRVVGRVCRAVPCASTVWRSGH
jgi:hypothetical protein